MWIDNGDGRDESLHILREVGVNHRGARRSQDYGVMGSSVDGVEP